MYNRVLAAIICPLTVVAMIRYLWLVFGSSVFAVTAPSSSNGQLDKFGDITSVEDGSAPKVGPAAGPWNGGNNGSANVQVNSSALEYYFGDTLIPGWRYKLAELVMQAQVDSSLWHQRLGHLNRENMDFLKKQHHNGVSFDGTVSDCDVCDVGKSQQIGSTQDSTSQNQATVLAVFYRSGGTHHAGSPRRL